MPITLKELTARLEEIGYSVMVPDGQDTECGLRFATESYINPEGEHSVLVICKISEDGSYLELFTPNAYDSRNCKFKAALFASMLQVAYMTKHLQLEHDPSDGEVRFAVDIPVCDGSVTTRQLYSMVRCLTCIVEEYHPVFTHAMETGKIDLSRVWKPKEPTQTPEAAAKPPMPPEMAALLEKFGLEGVEKLLAEQRASHGSA
jgi:hypothetical protein